MMKVTFIQHSGFFVEMEDACFLFDYYREDIPTFDRTKKLYVFASHLHQDHYNPKIFEMREKADRCWFILDRKIKAPKAEDVCFVHPRTELEIEGCRIRTLLSTDEGVAFLIRYAGRTIYHAGDLNWWHWEEESESYNAQMRGNYQKEIDTLKDLTIDVAFIPVDPRLEKQYTWGLEYFMKQTDTKNVFPMHFWRKYKTIDKLMQEPCIQEYKEKIWPISHTGEEFLL